MTVKKTELKKETTKTTTVKKKKPSTATKKTVAKGVVKPKTKPSFSEINSYISNFRSSRSQKVKLKHFADQECMVYEITIDVRSMLSNEDITNEEVNEILSDLVRDLDGNKIFTETFTASQTFGIVGASELLNELVDISLKHSAKNS